MLLCTPNHPIQVELLCDVQGRMPSHLHVTMFKMLKARRHILSVYPGPTAQTPMPTSSATSKGKMKSTLTFIQDLFH